MSLEDLPFPLEELSWDKLPEVQKHLKLKKDDAISLLAHAIGPRLPATWIGTNLY